ncbi:acyltransferase [Clostridium sp.]|uniref:acyltransferase n=1 Tax=Clostridium sp. TaxID=1506 RepID=UPI003217DBF1
MICRISNRIMRQIRLNRIKKIYKTSNLINLYGKVQLDNPNIIFGNNVSLYSGVQIWGDGQITIGDNVAIGKDTIIFAHKPMYIGSDTSIAGQCYIIDSDHGIVRSSLIREQPLDSEPIYIGRDVWIGAGCKILKGSIISDGAIIGAMGLVKNIIEPYSINVGIPVKKIGERD